MNIKKTVLVLLAAIASSHAHFVCAENSVSPMPPPGPYRPVGDVDQYNLNQNDQTDIQLNRTIPEWVKQHQVQMNRVMPPAQAWNNQQAQPIYNRAAPMMNSGYYPGQRNFSGQNYYMGGYPPSNIAPNFQAGRMQQFPYANAPVYGRTPPPEYYRQPVYPGSGY